MESQKGKKNKSVVHFITEDRVHESEMPHLSKFSVQQIISECH